MWQECKSPQNCRKYIRKFFEDSSLWKILVVDDCNSRAFMKYFEIFNLKKIKLLGKFLIEVFFSNKLNLIQSLKKFVRWEFV